MQSAKEHHCQFSHSSICHSFTSCSHVSAGIPIPIPIPIGFLFPSGIPFPLGIPFPCTSLERTNAYRLVLEHVSRNAGIAFADLNYALDTMLFLNHPDQFIRVLKSTEQESAKLDLYVS